MNKETKKNRGVVVYSICILLLVFMMMTFTILNSIIVQSSNGAPAAGKAAEKVLGQTDKNKIADEATKTKENINNAQANDKVKNEEKSFWSCTHMTTPIGIFTCYGIWALSIARGIELGYDVVKDGGYCSVEKPYIDLETARCRSCNADPFRICTKERCEILGKCIAVKKENFSNPDIKGYDPAKDINYECVPGQCKNYGLVAFTKINATWALSDGTMLPSYTNQVTKTIASNISIDLGPIEYNTKTINITVTTDQLAKCRYAIDKAGSKFEDMLNFDTNDYPNDGSENMKPIPQSVLVLLPGDLTRDENHTIYIKCSNVCNAVHNQYYDHNQIRFKFKPKPDSMWPSITFLDPTNNAVVSNEWTKLNVSLWLDENGKCFYATKATNWNITLSNMTPMSENGAWQDDPYYKDGNSPVIRTYCVENKECKELRKDVCGHCFIDLDLTKGADEINWSMLPQDYQDQLDPMGLYNTTKMFRIMLRCQDLSPQKNTMPEEETLNYIIMTMPPYNITIITPENDSKTYDPQPEIQVISGVRNTECKYLTSTNSNLIPEWDKMTFIDDVTSTTHSGKHNETLQGDNYPGKAYTLYALCRDEWGMEARATAHFSVIADTKPAVLIRTYHDAIGGSFLILETDELSTCSYTYDTCKFNYSQGAMMTGDNQTIHSAYWSEKTLFVKCQDQYGNFPTSLGSYTKDPTYPWCTAILRPFEIPTIS